MTQNAQTTTEMPTADRIEDIIVCNFEFDRFGRVTNTNHDKSAQTIAAEIDALTAERDGSFKIQDRLESENLTLTVQLAEARAQIGELKAELDPWRVMFPVNTPAEIATKLMRGGS